MYVQNMRRGQQQNQQQPRNGSQATQKKIQGQQPQYDPSQRASTKRRAPIKQNQNQLRKKQDQDEQPMEQQIKSKNQSEFAIIKNSDLEILKNGIKDNQQKKNEEKILSQHNQDYIQNANENKPPNQYYQNELQQQELQQFIQKEQEEANNNNMRAQGQPKNVTSTTQYGNLNPMKNAHSVQIVGQNIPRVDAMEQARINKEEQQKKYQEELQRQIRERDELRKNEYDQKYKRPGSLNRRIVSQDQSPSLQNDHQFQVPRTDIRNENQDLMNSEQNLEQQLQDINIWFKMIYSRELNQQQQNQNMQSFTNSTKMDFPQIMTRGKVVENRVDLQLESKGTIFQGRDEKSILIKKKENQQQAIREALQKQIEEKNKKKEDEKQRILQAQMMEENRISNQNYQNQFQQESQQQQQQQQQPNQELIAGRKTYYNNHHQVSIIGSGIGQSEFKLPDIEASKSPVLKQISTPMKPQPNLEDSNENINQVIPTRQSIEESNSVIKGDSQEVNEKNQQINELNNMVKQLYEEQQQLKNKLEQREKQPAEVQQRPKQQQSQMQRKQTAINSKKASERVRSQNPPKKVAKSADNKTLQQRKKKEQDAIEQAKLEAIEEKIQKARKRIEDTKKVKSIKAVQSQQRTEKLMQNNEDLDDIYGNQDEDLISQQQSLVNQHVPKIGGRKSSNLGMQRANNQISTAPHKNQKLHQGLNNQKQGSIPQTSQVRGNQRNISQDENGRSQNSQMRKPPNNPSSHNLPFDSIEQLNESDLQNRQAQSHMRQQMNSISYENTPQSNKSRKINNNQNHTESTYNLDNDGISYLTYPNQEAAFLAQQQEPQYLNQSPGRSASNYDPNMYQLPPQNVPYDSSNYQPKYSQQVHNRQKQMSNYDIEQSAELQGSREFIHGKIDFISKNPSTAAASYLPGNIGNRVTSGGMVQQQYPNESFDLDLMMPPDINSIDSDLNKLGSLTPAPMQNNQRWELEGEDQNDMNYDNYLKQSYNFGGQPQFQLGQTLQFGNIPQDYDIDDQQQYIYDSQFSPGRDVGSMQFQAQQMYAYGRHNMRSGY